MMNMSGTKCVHCGEDDDGNTQTCKKGCNQIKIFGVQIGVNGGAAAESSSFRKSKSMGNIEAFISENATAEEEEEPSGYLSDGSAHEYSKSHERKRGKPWSEAEHRSFLEGLEKLGKGDWKGIATKFVHTRKSSQVASHAQKYFNRLNLIAANKKRRRGSVFDIPLTHNSNQPTQGSQSNNAHESLHIATTSAAASKNIGELKVLPSMNMQTHDMTSERPPLSPKKRDFHGVFYQPRISWVPVVEHVPIQNGTGFVGNAQQRYGTVMPQPSVDAVQLQQHYATVMPQPSADAVQQGWHQVLLTTTNNELNLINAYGYRQGWYRASNDLNLNVGNLAL